MVVWVGLGFFFGRFKFCHLQNLPEAWGDCGNHWTTERHGQALLVEITVFLSFLKDLAKKYHGGPIVKCGLPRRPMRPKEL